MADPRKPPVIRDNTPEEEAAIRRGMNRDPDSGSTGNPAPLRHVLPLDADVLQALREADPVNWRQKANDLLRQALAMPEAAE